MLRAIEQGYVQQEIQRSAFEYQRGIEQRRHVVVGVNEYVVPEAHPMDIMRVDQRVTAAQLEKLSTLKRQRDQSRVTAVLDRLREAARGTANLIPIVGRHRGHAWWRGEMHGNRWSAPQRHGTMRYSP
jgi:methylmalonyl-CoA mutase N-terminal domain/subunit